uniref:Uncharacterized protein n=1 Tax=Glossina morsitans morsitans TaxID=37546 RepID=A0A1B0F9Q6_GLOMM
FLFGNKTDSLGLDRLVAFAGRDNFPHDIEISITTDFYSVGWRDNYITINISDFVAQFEEYSKGLIYHNYQRRLWLAHLLFPKADSIDISTRRGGFLAFGEIILVLTRMDVEKLSKEGESNVYLSNQAIANLNGFIMKFLQRDLFRGMSGELMKQCCTDFTRNLAKIEVSMQCLDKYCAPTVFFINRFRTKDSWQIIIDRSLINKTPAPNETVLQTDACLLKMVAIT